jgi:uncharacterized protein (TIGR03032 family)
MTTSQLLRNLIDSRALIVSSHSDNSVLSLQNDTWNKTIINNARGIAVSDTFVTIASHEAIYYYNKNDGTLAAIVNIASQDSHEITYDIDENLIVCASYRSALVKQGLGIDEILWTVPGVSLNTFDARSWINGVAIQDGYPKYVSVLGVSDIPQGWTDEARTSKGVIFDVTNNNIIMDNLFFPHSPKIINNELWFCNSGNAQLCKWAPGDSNYTVVTELSGWSRGILSIGDYVLVGISQGKLTAFPEITADPMAQPGISIIDKNTGEQVDFEPLDVQEIFDINITDKALI